MLRRKLLARLGLLVVGFVTGAVVSILLLQTVLADLDALKSDADSIVDGVQNLGSALAAFEGEATRVRTAGATAAGGDAQPLEAKKQDVARILDTLAAHEVMRPPFGEGAAVLRSIRDRVPAFMADATRESAGAAPGPEVLAGSASLRASIADLGAIARKHVADEQRSLSRRLRTLIVALTIAALAMTNIAILVLVRTANMILRPVGELIEGSRALAAERFDYRIQISRRGKSGRIDEFEELAHAYNALAEQLASNEQRKVKALQQLAVTLNHELNNVINAIELQLRLLDRRSGGDPALTAQLGSIHANLERMARTIASLRSVRRIVLTDYLPGELMLDLPRCIAPDAPPAPAEHTGANAA